jgi:hypothetical protein
VLLSSFEESQTRKRRKAKAAGKNITVNNETDDGYSE